MLENLQNTTDGDVLSLDNISGPTICCVWVCIRLLSHSYEHFWNPVPNLMALGGPVTLIRTSCGLPHHNRNSLQEL